MCKVCGCQDLLPIDPHGEDDDEEEEEEDDE
jgi:hypothetical protein